MSRLMSLGWAHRSLVCFVMLQQYWFRMSNSHVSSWFLLQQEDPFSSSDPFGSAFSSSSSSSNKKLDAFDPFGASGSTPSKQVGSLHCFMCFSWLGLWLKYVWWANWPVFTCKTWWCANWASKTGLRNKKFDLPHDKTNKMACAASEDSDQPGHLPSLIRVLAVRMKKAWVLSYPLSIQWRLWSDWSDAQADLKLYWVHMPFCWFVMKWLQFVNMSSNCNQNAETLRRCSTRKGNRHYKWDQKSFKCSFPHIRRGQIPCSLSKASSSFLYLGTGHSRYVDFAYLDTTIYVEVIFHSQHFFSIFLCISTLFMSKTVNMKHRVSRGDFSCLRRIFYYICYCLCRSKNRRLHGHHIVCFGCVHVLAEVRTSSKQQ